VRLGGVIAAYASRADRPDLPFWPLLFNNVTLRLLGSDDFPMTAKEAAALDLNHAAATGALTMDTTVFPLAAIAEAHDLVDAGGRARVLVASEQ
jgi:NADPH2:quinone reductase